MSIDTIALFEVPDAKPAVDTILECALTMPGVLCRVDERFGTFWLPKEWKYDGSHLLGPGGFSIRPKGRIVTVYHLLRFSTFTQQAEDGRIVLDAFHFIGRVIGSAEMIVCHELLPCEGNDLNMIAEHITNVIGPSAASLDELGKSSAFQARCWMRLSVRATD
jgi:hypothetical protein